ncbi:hypothetical protein L5F64_03650 [Aliarcobacter butzleri]|uniref:hypothetical protein n=1 Tax=Aliarcobacter butzleri TaxID=28197 RepID=UPI001EDA48E0|nr:hypothetical protein [Aliarcobacter butzleri]MCG3709636.1 hypothetical protein [Aliarcobacter butzleri]MCG3714655.1 hypothetical protein [Aliarcobacter butzleri]
MKTYIKVFLPLLIVFIFNGCGAIKLSKYDLKETYSEKHVLVYDKTISLPTSSYISNMQFSPTNKDEIAISLRDTIKYDLFQTDHFMLIDLKSGKLKKDIKLDKTKALYSINFKYSEDGKRIYISRIYEEVIKTRCDIRGKNGGGMTHIFEYGKNNNKDCTKIEDIIIKELTKDKFTILDLETNNLVHNYYNCDNFISQEYKNKEGVEVSCYDTTAMKNFRKYQYIDRLNKKSGEGIAPYDKDSFKTKKIITADNRLDTQFKVVVISEDGQYVLFEKVIRDSKEHITNRKYVVYDLKNDKSIHSFDAPFTVYGRGEAFIDKDSLLFEYGENGEISSKRNLGIVNLVTNEKKSFFCHEKKICSINKGIYNLNNRYMIWAWYSTIYIFDKKEMKIVQEFNGVENFTLSRDFKKVIFYTLNNDLYLYDIKQGE